MSTEQPRDFIQNLVMSLDAIGLSYGTDKASNGHNYLKYYEMFLAPIRLKNIALLEIGVDKGASLKMWSDYFPNGRITGWDIDDKKEYEIENKIWTFKVDQSDKWSMLNTIQNICYTIICEDGSHNAEDQILTFETLFPHVIQGGYYIIEDCLCSFDKERWGKNANVYDRIKEMVGEVNMNGKISNYEINADKKKQILKYDNLTYFEKNIEWVFNSLGLCIIKKI